MLGLKTLRTSNQIQWHPNRQYMAVVERGGYWKKTDATMSNPDDVDVPARWLSCSSLKKLCDETLAMEKSGFTLQWRNFGVGFKMGGQEALGG